MSNAFNYSSGAVRGIQRLEPFHRPPCGIHVEERRRGHRTAQEDIAAGASAAQLREVGYTARELGFAGISARELRQSGFPILQIAAAGCFRAHELRSAGATVLDCMGAGLLMEELVLGGYTAREFGVAGVSASALRALGFDGTEAGAAAPSPGRGRVRQQQRPRTAPGTRAPPVPLASAPAGAGPSSSRPGSATASPRADLRNI